MVGSLPYLLEYFFETIIEDTEVNCCISRMTKHSAFFCAIFFIPLIPSPTDLFVLWLWTFFLFYRTSMVIYVNLCKLGMLGSVRIVIVCRKKNIILSFIIDIYLLHFNNWKTSLTHLNGIIYFFLWNYTSLKNWLVCKIWITQKCRNMKLVNIVIWMLLLQNEWGWIFTHTEGMHTIIKNPCKDGSNWEFFPEIGISLKLYYANEDIQCLHVQEIDNKVKYLQETWWYHQFAHIPRPSPSPREILDLLLVE